MPPPPATQKAIGKIKLPLKHSLFLLFIINTNRAGFRIIKQISDPIPLPDWNTVVTSVYIVDSYEAFLCEVSFSFRVSCDSDCESGIGIVLFAKKDVKARPCIGKS